MNALGDGMNIRINLVLLDVLLVVALLVALSGTQAVWSSHLVASPEWDAHLVSLIHALGRTIYLFICSP